MCQIALPAQQDMPVRNISSSGGLSNDFVLSLAIDGQNYVWVATESGLNRIAGTNCQPMPMVEPVAGQRITAVFWYKRTDDIMIGTERGLTIYDPQRGSSRQLNASDGLVASSINHIAGADGDNVWLIYGNGQVQRLNCLTMTTEELELSEPHSNRCALDDGKGNLYLGHSQHGMTVMNITGHTARNYQHKADDERSIPGNNVRIIYKDRAQRIWVGTDQGLALFHPESGTFTRVAHPSGIYHDNVYDIMQTADGTLWVATDIGGLRCLNPDSPVPAYEDTDIRLSSKNTRCIVQDEFGNIWVGQHSTGVDFISAQKPVFTKLDYTYDDNTPQPIYAITPDNEGGVYMAGETELTQWQQGRMTGLWSASSIAQKEFSLPRTLMTDRTGRLWIGADDQGVFTFDRATGRFEHIDALPEGADIHAFVEDEEGRIWIGSEAGVYVWQDGRISLHEFISNTISAPATCIMQTAPGQMFVATLGDGIWSFDINAMTSRHISFGSDLPSGKINQVVGNARSGLWLATDGGLVHLSDPIGLGGINTYALAEGLADCHVLALQQAEEGVVWLSTYAGISRFSEATGRFSNYGTLGDGTRPGGFAVGAASTDASGTIYFGSATGVLFFHPSQINNMPAVSDVQIVSCQAYNPVGQDTEILLLHTDETGVARTTYRQNTLRIAFTVRNFAQTGQVEYSYKMEGMDGKWYYIDDDNDVVFRGLRPGSYTFILRAKLKDQEWQQASETRMKIEIAPPFWSTWWAWLLYIVLLAAAGWYAFWAYKKRLTQQAQIDMERKESRQKEELNEERLRFFTNITHELRTPLTLIIGPLQDLADDAQMPPQARRRVNMIQKSAERLRNLITDILEFRKTETQNRRLSVAKGDIGLFVREICLNYKELYNNPKVQFSYNIAEGLPQVFFDSEVITTIMNNLLSNAIKYTEQGSISTTVKAEGNTLSIAVADTGYGIAPEALSNIFDRYYQAKGSHQAAGTGIGLALVKSLTELHEGTISVESQEGKGSCFTLQLNTDNTYPSALHKEDTQEEGKKPAATQPEQENENAGEQTEAEMPALLIVEDNADIRQYIADSFGEDFQILQAENGEEGVRMALKHTPDIIVSDIMMPRLNGIQLTRQLKGDLRTSHIPIILLTAKVTDSDKEEGYDSGADSYLTKPFTAKLLGSRIQNLLTARRRLAEHLTTHPVATGQKDAEDSVPQLSRLDREFLDKLNAVIRDNIMTNDIDLPFVTDKMAMSHSTFYRKVKALTGLTAKEYIRKFRLQYCYQLLESGDYNVNEAAMMTGFNQMAHFRETFKNEFGILPSELLHKKS
ncbi:MAG: response regulator [Prevotella sp.]|nr:response regulator [Prevotella sp.]